MAQLIVFTGLPGVGKSAIAEAVGREFGIPVFSKNWLEATLLRCGLMPGTQAGRDLGYACYELLTTLAGRQLDLGQSVILDSDVSRKRVRNQWRELAESHRMTWQVVEVVCSSETTHQSRLAARNRDAAGRGELTWKDVEAVRSRYEPWGDQERLILDTVEPLKQNIQAALKYLKPPRA